MPLLDVMVERHDAIIKRAQNIDARFYDQVKRASFGGIIFSGIGIATVSPACGLLTVAFGVSAVHFDNKSRDAAKPDYRPSPGSIEKAEGLHMVRN